MANPEIAEKPQQPKDASTAQSSAKLNAEANQPGQAAVRAEGGQMPPEFPQMTIVGTRENGVAKPLYQVGVADNVIRQDQPREDTARQQREIPG